MRQDFAQSKGVLHNCQLPLVLRKIEVVDGSKNSMTVSQQVCIHVEVAEANIVVVGERR
jgi:hypothetical protein